jgi:ABC-type nitrate/sulfonate/bicarbonate transport system substrate-binding protein
VTFISERIWLPGRWLGLFAGGLALLAACSPTPPAAQPATQPPAAPATQSPALTKPAASPSASPSASTSAAATPAGAASKATNLSVEFGATALTAFNWTESIAEQKGFWTAEGLQVRRTMYQTDAQSTQALIGGSANIIQATIDATIRADVKGNADLKMVGSNVNNPPYAIMGKPEVKTWQDLTGKKAAVTDLTGGSTMLLKLAMKANSVDPSGVSLIAAGGTSNRFAALRSGSVDFTVLAQPQNYDAQAEGYSTIGYTSDFVKDFQFTGYVVSAKWANDHQEELIRFLRGVHTASEWLYEPKNKPEAIALFVPVIKVQPESLAKTWDQYFGGAGNVVPRNGQPNLPGIEVVIKALADQGELEGSLPKAEQFVDLSYIRKAVP